ncbi:hypothetical protein [Streptomyces sp. NPDC005799]|uniref:hypothetical protein n=1 Tax=Streptomyces sp. NPDC005799 TaxID=3154678 RepID=UPI0033DA10DA
MSIRSSSPQPDDTSIAARHATVDALRAVGTDRSVEDVTRLMAPAPTAVDLAPRILPRTPNRRPVRQSWPGVLAAAVLLLCGMLWFPLHRDGAPPQSYALTLGASTLCTLLTVVLTLRPTLPAFAVAAVVPTVLAAGRLYEGRFHSEPLSRALDLTLAPSWIAGVAAVCAALAALTGVLVRLAAQQPKAAAPPRPPAAARRTPD